APFSADSGRVPAPGDGAGGVGAGVDRVRGVRHARPTPGVLGAGRRVGVRGVPTAGGGPPRSGYVDVDGGAGQRGRGDRGSRGAGGAAAGRGAGGGAPSVALGARVTISAAGRSRGGSVTRKPVRPPSPHPSGARPPALPPEALPRHVAIVM